MLVELRGNEIRADKFRPKTKKEFVSFMQNILPYRSMGKETRRKALNDDWLEYQRLTKEEK